MVERTERRSRGGAGRVPPHNVEAEASLLGALLLSPDAIASVAELGVGPDDFYKPAHQFIFDAVRTLVSSGEPADAVTVADELRRAGVLEDIGGPASCSTCRPRRRPSPTPAATAGSCGTPHCSAA